MVFSDASRRSVLGFISVAIPMVLVGCAESTPRPVSFPRLSYSYLPLLRLNVASIEIENDWRPDPTLNHLEALSPETPLAALREMAKDRLAAVGSSGKATFIIQDASIVGADGELRGSFAVRLEVRSADGLKSGFCAARTARSVAEPASRGPKLRAALYDLVRTMMNTMNVDFEFQLRRSLGGWLVSTGATSAPVEAQPLTAPGAASGATSTVPQAPGTSGSSLAPTPLGAQTTAPSGASTPKAGILGTLPMPLHPSTTP